MSELRRITEDYRLDERVRSSAAASVFRATDLTSGRTVAVKLITGDPALDSEDGRERFLSAAGILRTLSHPCLPRVLDFGLSTAGTPFLVTEYLEGESLESFAGSPPSGVLSLLEQAADGLAALEAAGLAHGNLRAENLLVVAGPEGERVELLGIRGFAPDGDGGAAEPTADRRADLAAFAGIACRMLGASVATDGAAPRVDLPSAAAVALAEPEALRSRLQAALRPGAEPPPTYAELRRALRPAPAGTLATGRAARSPAPFGEDTVMTSPPGPPPSAAVPEALPLPPRPTSPRRVAAANGQETEEIPSAPQASPRRRPWAIGAGLAALVVVIAVFLFRPRPEPGPPAVPTETSPAMATAVPAAVPPVPPDTTPPEPAPPPVAPSSSPETLARDLAAALAAGDLTRLRAADAALRAADPASLPTGAKKDQERARLALDLEKRLSRSKQAGRQEEILRDATALLAVLPRSARAAAARKGAAAVIEAEADTDVEAGRFEPALQGLEGLRRSWPDRAGLAARVERAEAERAGDQKLESLLAEVDRQERAKGPQAALELLAGTAPNRRFDERFRQARARLETQVARIDRTPPAIAFRGSLGEYEKGATVAVPLSITDDHLVASAELWARPKGAPAFTKLALRHLAGADFVADIAPSLHQNKTIEFYVTARDDAGNQGLLGSPNDPRQLKRKRNWLIEKLPGGD